MLSFKCVCAEFSRIVMEGGQFIMLFDLSRGLQFNSNILVRKKFFLKNYVTSEGAVSHSVLYYQQLFIAHYQVSFYASN